jgi:hypothetical protein
MINDYQKWWSQDTSLCGSNAIKITFLLWHEKHNNCISHFVSIQWMCGTSQRSPYSFALFQYNECIAHHNYSHNHSFSGALWKILIHPCIASWIILMCMPPFINPFVHLSFCVSLHLLYFWCVPAFDIQFVYASIYYPFMVSSFH